MSKPLPADATDPADLSRELHVRPGVGGAACVLQARGLRMLRLHVDQPALIVVHRGIKTITPARGAAVRARPGQAILVDGNQTVDFSNEVPDGTHYEARWVLFDDALLEDGHYAERAAAHRQREPLRLVSPVLRGMADAFEGARRAIAPDAALPDAVARQRVLELMHWLLEDGAVVRSVPLKSSASTQVRSLIAGRLEAGWTTGRVCGELALSEATLRRRLGAEGTTLGALLVDARMSTALTLLQATSRPVSDIACAVGYESPSRFAIRFRQRFGFAPTAVRGHERA